MDGNGFINGNDNSNLFGSPAGMNTSVPGTMPGAGPGSMPGSIPGMNTYTTDMTGSNAGIGAVPETPVMNNSQPVSPLQMQSATQAGAMQPGATQAVLNQQSLSGGAGSSPQYYQPAASAQLNNGMPMQQGMQQGMPMQGMTMQGAPVQGMPMQGMPMAGMGMPMPGMGMQMGAQPLSGPIYDVPPSDMPKSIIKTADIVGSLGSVLFGLPFLLVGIFVGVAMFTGIEGMEATGAKWLIALFPILFGGAGIWVMFSGVLNIIKDMKENKKFKQIASYGKALDARAANVDIVSQVRVNGNSKQALVCLWNDPETGALHTFTSKGDYNNKYYLVGQPLRVFVNPGNLEEYIVDLSKVSYASAMKNAANMYMNRGR